LTIEGGEHTFTQPLVVPPGATLVIRNATIYLDAPKVCPARGSFEFCVPQLFVMPGGTLVAENTTFDTHDPTGLYRGYRIYAHAGVLSITDSRILRANVVGGEEPGPAPSRIERSFFAEGVQTISFTRGMDAHVVGNRIERSTGGIDIRDSAVSTIRDNSIQVSGNGIDVQATSVGDKALPTRVLVEGNTVTGGLVGFFTLNSYGSTVRRNVFRGNRFGAILGVFTGDYSRGREDILFEENLLEDNEYAINAYTAISGGARERYDIVVPVRRNSVLRTACHSVWADPTGHANVSLTIDARENWWGSPEGPQDGVEPGCSAVAGPALVSPWLTAPPD